MELVYSQTAVTLTGAQMFRNPRHFEGPEEGATCVSISGHWPAISAAYAAAGVPVIHLDPQPHGPLPMAAAPTMSPKVYASLIDAILCPPSLWARVTAWITARCSR